MNKNLLSLPVRGAWIEIVVHAQKSNEIVRSLPVRGAWIEISPLGGLHDAGGVAPRAGSVD